MKYCFGLSQNTGPQSANLSEDFSRIKENADPCTNDKLVQTEAIELQAICNEATEGSEASEEKESSTEECSDFCLYLEDYNKISENIEITENYYIKRYASIIFSNFYRVRLNSLVLCGYPGYGVTTTAMYLAKLISQKRCPDRFLGAKVIKICKENFNNIFSPEDIRTLLESTLYVLKKEGYSKIILFFDDLEDIPQAFLSEFKELTQDLKELFELDVLNFLIGANLVFFENDESNYALSLSKNSVFINMEIESKLPMVLKVLKPRIKELAVKHSNIKVGPTILDKVALVVFSKLGNYLNYKNFLDAIDWIFSICEKDGCKKLCMNNIREYSLREFMHFESLSYERQLQIAKHEAGHTILALHEKDYISVIGVMIIGDNQTEGATYVNYVSSSNDVDTIDRRAVVAKIAFLLAGRVAQKRTNLGASSDLEKANEIAKSFIQSIGSDFGKGYIFDHNEEKLSNSTLENYESLVKEILEEGYNYATEVLHIENESFEALVNLLMKKKILTNNELNNLWDAYHK